MPRRTRGDSLTIFFGSKVPRVKNKIISRQPPSVNSVETPTDEVSPLQVGLPEPRHPDRGDAEAVIACTRSDTVKIFMVPCRRACKCSRWKDEPVYMFSARTVFASRGSRLLSQYRHTSLSGFVLVAPQLPSSE